MHHYAEGSVGNVEKHWNSLYQLECFMHRYAEGTLGNAAKQLNSL